MRAGRGGTGPDGWLDEGQGSACIRDAPDHYIYEAALRTVAAVAAGGAHGGQSEASGPDDIVLHYSGKDQDGQDTNQRRRGRKQLIRRAREPGRGTGREHL